MTKLDQIEFGFLTLVLLCLLVAGGVAHGGWRGGLPGEQWDWETHMWLSRGFVGEAGWDSVDDHIAMANVLKRRWEQVSTTYPGADISFLDQVRGYMRGMRRSESVQFSDRTKWVRNLPYEMPATDAPLRADLREAGWDAMLYRISPPRHWNTQKAPWKRYIRKWNMVLRRAADWRMGLYADKCPEAMHWGGDMDDPASGFEVVDCGDTFNTFYKRKKKR